MNKVTLVGRLTRDPEVRYPQGGQGSAVGRYTLAVDRRFKRDGEAQADFIPCVVFGKGAEFAEKYFRRGMRVGIVGRIQTGSYTNKDGNKVYTTDVIVDEQEFCESKSSGTQTNTTMSVPDEAPKPQQASTDGDGFMSIPADDLDELPFT